MIEKNYVKTNIGILGRPGFLWLMLALVVLGSSGCFTRKNQLLFRGMSDTSYSASMQQIKPVIQRGDQLSIMVFGYDQESVQYFNMPMGGGQGGGMMMQGGQGGGGMMGYIVSEEGTIEFPKLGTMNVLGYNQEQLRDTLQQRLKPYVNSPIVNVRLLNFRVTYLTTDRAQTIFIMNNKTNIIQFLGMVGGISWTDRKNNILLIRQVDNKRTVTRLDFTQKDIFDSEYFYMQPNDIIYVEPNQRKFLETNIQLISLVTSITSTVSIFFLFINSLK
ncbi:MAG: polysaccharide biosynthesis/export family protein [Bacteroidota bacterium]